MTRKLKHQGYKVGDVIRAYDFKPMAGRKDRYVEGKIISLPTDRGYACYEVEADGTTHYEKGQSVFVPFEVAFMKYKNRVVLIKAAE